jgi:hypothetical protein
MNEHDIDRESDMAKQTGYTKGPWHIGMKPGPMVYGPLGEQIVGINVMLDQPEVTANALRIVQCVNSHDELVEALRECYALLTNPDAEPDDADAVTYKISTLLKRINA